MKMNAILVLSLLLKVAVSIQPIPDADDQLHIYALPVGQGDCTVIQCPKAKDGSDPQKGTVTIIDDGSSTNNTGINGRDIVDFLAGTKLNLVVLTHSDKDHINYIDNLLEYYKKNVLVYHSCKWSKHYKDYIKSQYANPQEIPPCQNIMECFNVLNLCPNYQPNVGMATSVKLFFVASAVGGCKNNKAHNEDSLISKITYAGKSTLIVGDFELEEGPMKKFLNKAGSDLQSDIYRLSHHGAYNKDGNLANQIQFLDAVNASYVFSSSGFRYPYNHPRCQIYDYYEKAFSTVAVAKHPYTCYNSGNKKDYKIINTKKPIYVTSVYQKPWLFFLNALGFSFDVYKCHMIVKFDITITGRINVETMEVRDIKGEL